MAEHGTTSRYQHQACRCPLCREAQRLYARRYRSTVTGRDKTQMGNKAATKALWRLAQAYPAAYKQFLREEKAALAAEAPTASVG